MKISLCSIAFRDESIEQIIPRVAQLGYDGIEIWGKHIEAYLQGGGNLIALRELCEKNNLKIPVISPYFNFSETDEEYNKSLELAKKFIKYAEELKCNIIRTFVSKVGSKEATESQWKKVITGLKKICDWGENRDIIFALETHPGQLMDNVESTLKLIKEVNKDNLKVLLDIWHLYNEGEEEPIEALESLYEYIVHIHAKNMKRNGENNKIVYLEDGDMDYKKFLIALKERGYNKFISVEWFGEDSWIAAKHEIEYLKRLEEWGMIV